MHSLVYKLKLKLKDFPFSLPLANYLNFEQKPYYFLAPRSEIITIMGILNKNLTENITPEIRICEKKIATILKVNKDNTTFTSITFIDQFAVSYC
jgi:hypothetical protein